MAWYISEGRFEFNLVRSLLTRWSFTASITILNLGAFYKDLQGFSAYFER